MRAVSDAELIALIPQWREEAEGRSPSSFVRWCKRRGIKVGASRAKRLIDSAPTAIPTQYREWEALGKNGQIVKLRHTTYKVHADPTAIVRGFIKAEVKPLGPVEKKVLNRLELVGVLSVPDIHIGKLAWGEEVGENYDTNIAVNVYLKAASELIDYFRRRGVGRVVYVVGNDLMHVDGQSNTTTKGTPQDTDTRFQKAAQRAKEMVVSTANALAEFADVDLVIIPGNHDKHLTYMLGMVLEAYYKDTPSITVHAAPKTRKYLVIDKLLFGFAHGDELKERDLPQLMATEMRNAWGQTSWSEWFLGHKHKRREAFALGTQEQMGTMITWLPSLTPPDRWHFERGYIGHKWAEARIYNSKRGVLLGTAASFPEATPS